MPASIRAAALCAMLFVAFAVAPAHAQSYPTRPLRMLVPYPPGGATDFVARLLGQKLSDALGQSIVIENRGGGGGAIAAESAARAAPDGYTIYFGTPASLCILPAIQRKLPYDTARDFAPVGRMVVNPQILVASAGFPPGSLAELIQLARSNPGKYTFASAGVGSPQHLGLEVLKARAAVDIVHVPYKGGAAAMADVLGGRVHMHMGSIPSMVPHIKAGKIKVLAIAGTERSPLFPEAAMISEVVKGYDFVGTWYGLFTQTKVPKDIVAKLNGVLNAALRAEDVRQQLIAQGSDPRPTTVEEFARFVQSDCPAWGRAAKAAGLRPE